MGSMNKSGSGELALMERIKTLREEVEDLTAQLEQAKSDISSLNSHTEWKQLVEHYTGESIMLSSIEYRELIVIYEIAEFDWKFNYYIVFPNKNYTFSFSPYIDYPPTKINGYGYINISYDKLVITKGTFSNVTLTVLYR